MIGYSIMWSGYCTAHSRIGTGKLVEERERERDLMIQAWSILPSKAYLVSLLSLSLSLSTFTCNVNQSKIDKNENRKGRLSVWAVSLYRELLRVYFIVVGCSNSFWVILLWWLPSSCGNDENLGWRCERGAFVKNEDDEEQERTIKRSRSNE